MLTRAFPLQHWSSIPLLHRALMLSVALHLLLFMAIGTGVVHLGAPGFASRMQVQLLTAPATATSRGTPESVLSAAPAAAGAGPRAAPASRRAGAAEVAQPVSVALAPVVDVLPASVAVASVLTAVASAAVVDAPGRQVAAARPMDATEQLHLERRIPRIARLLESMSAPTELAWEEGGRRYSASVVPRPAASPTDLDRVEVVVSTADQGETLRSRLQFKRVAFSHFAQFVHRWNERVQLHDDDIQGRFHSNSQIIVGWDGGVAPRFVGEVSTTHGFRYAYAARRPPRPMFPAGLNPRAAPIAMPDRLAEGFARQLQQRASGVQRLYFDDSTQLLFHGDGTMDIRPLRSTEPARRESIGSAPLYLMARDGAALQVQGQVQGTVLVYSPRQIIISGPLTYAGGPGGSDFLGLVSDGDVVIAGEDQTGRGDLEVHAAIFARRTFLVRDFETQRGARLSILGSLSAGTIDASEPRYALRVVFDPRFERTRPPDFPQTSRYALESWDEQWTVDGKGNAAP